MSKNILVFALTLPFVYLTAQTLTISNEIKKTSAYSFEKYNAYGHLDDNDITRKLKLALDIDEHIDSTDIDVNTRNGVVQLSGKIDSHSDKERAIKLALNSRGVRAVKDDMKTN